ncbi:unnamed protein product [Arabis nemorensis]|uniref:ER membrane protein complex subunit 4 n=1 Tax=Arabis nemorensis TaxID=586526 RepID=A0A565CBY9_9BRAS|nr:unnamed protein product [Arabis nemorensis]
MQFFQGEGGQGEERPGGNCFWYQSEFFEPFKDNKVELLVPKLVFLALNLGGLALGIWKLNTLGLLPTHALDWGSSLAPPQKKEPFKECKIVEGDAEDLPFPTD